MINVIITVLEGDSYSLVDVTERCIATNKQGFICDDLPYI
jgi:hypothetical protein